MIACRISRGPAIGRALLFSVLAGAVAIGATSAQSNIELQTFQGVNSLRNSAIAEQAALTNLQTNVNGIQTALGNLQTSANGQQAVLTSLQISLTALQAAVAALQTAVGHIPTHSPRA